MRIGDWSSVVCSSDLVGVVRVRLLPDRRWSQLVDTAVMVLDTVPVRHVVIDDVATRAGVSRSLVYRYFSSLDELLGHAKRRFLTTWRPSTNLSSAAAGMLSTSFGRCTGAPGPSPPNPQVPMATSTLTGLQ